MYPDLEAKKSTYPVSTVIPVTVKVFLSSDCVPVIPVEGVVVIVHVLVLSVKPSYINIVDTAPLYELTVPALFAGKECDSFVKVAITASLLTAPS